MHFNLKPGERPKNVCFKQYMFCPKDHRITGHRCLSCEYSNFTVLKNGAIVYVCTFGSLITNKLY